jgi:hypothetical protein
MTNPRVAASKLVTPGSKPDTSTNNGRHMITPLESVPKDSAATDLVKPLTVVQHIVTGFKSADSSDYKYLA